jgi:hypothetical protein
VLLPAPFLPIIPMLSPGCTSKFTSSSAKNVLPSIFFFLKGLATTSLKERYLSCLIPILNCLVKCFKTIILSAFIHFNYYDYNLWIRKFFSGT